MPDGNRPARADTRDPVAPVRGRPWRAGLLAVVALAIVALWLYRRATVLVIDDARFLADAVVLSSPCDCTVEAVPAVEGGTGVRGGLAVVLAPEELPHELARARARLRAAEAVQTRIDGELRLLAHSTGRQRREAEAELAAARESQHLEREAVELAERKWQRARQLLDARLIARADFERIEAERLDVRAREAGARARTRHELLERDAGAERRLAVDAKRAERAEAGELVAALRAEVALLQLRLARRQVRFAGPVQVDRVFVRAGERVTTGRRLLLVHDPAGLFIEANVRETEVRHLKPGGRVTVVVDAYPARPVHGRIATIGTTTLGQFSALPSAAPSAAFVKVAQRVPVRIRVTDLPVPVGPGMQAEVRIPRRGT